MCRMGGGEDARPGATHGLQTNTDCLCTGVCRYFLLSLFAWSSKMTDDRASDPREIERECVCVCVTIVIIITMPPDARERGLLGGREREKQQQHFT